MSLLSRIKSFRPRGRKHSQPTKMRDSIVREKEEVEVQLSPESPPIATDETVGGGEFYKAAIDMIAALDLATNRGPDYFVISGRAAYSIGYAHNDLCPNCAYMFAENSSPTVFSACEAHKGEKS